ncbi:MAG: hypothetical protein HUU37_10000 [Bdellovibrionales bacterium]|nr:hypothetical protein [Bdellovibrionales bacterium]
MKKVFWGLMLLASPAMALTVTDARVVGGNLEVDVRYGGGCKEHSFYLEMRGCAESYPVQCNLLVKDHTTDDHCEALLGKTVVFNLAKHKLDDPYYNGASLRIGGVGQQNTVNVRLPRR